jgi:hypothetical protein
LLAVSKGLRKRAFRLIDAAVLLCRSCAGGI